jgi:hypothetical protein
MNTTTATQTTCQKPGCTAASSVWYRLSDDTVTAKLVVVCNDHGREIRESVNAWQIAGRGRMHNGIAEGAGR